MTPFRQGELDSLCGLYAILNGMQLAFPFGQLSKVQCRSLFKFGMEFLEECDCGDIVRNGLYPKDWHALARAMFDHLYERYELDLKSGKSAFRRLPRNRADAIAEVEATLARGFPVAVELRKALNHYTVVWKAEGDSWLLFDSQRNVSIKKRSIGMSGSAARHTLGERAIFFMPRF